MYAIRSYYEYHEASAKMLCLSLYFMWGTPFIYNGQEIGMSNYPFKKIEEFNDVSIHTRYEETKKEGRNLDEFIRKQSFESRDNARTAMQWDDSVYAGFTDSETDILINPNYKSINAEKQNNDQNSILNFYKNVIKLRKSEKYKDILVYGKFKMLFEKDRITSYNVCYTKLLRFIKIKY